MESANGTEPDGIKYRLHLEPPQYVVTVAHPDGRQLTERFNWTFDPRFGPDVADIAQGEEAMGRLIKILRQ